MCAPLCVNMPSPCVFLESFPGIHVFQFAHRYFDSMGLPHLLPHFECGDFFPEIKMAAQPSRLSLFACMMLAEGILQLWLLVVFWNPV